MTEISIRSYKNVEENRKRSENVMDSFSESSASELVKSDAHNFGIEEDTNDLETFSHEGSWEAGGGLNVIIPIKGKLTLKNKANLGVKVHIVNPSMSSRKSA